jgi:amidase
MTDDLAPMDATAQAALVRTGEATPRELVEAAIGRIERLNPKLGAVVDEVFDRAVASAADPALPDGPFRGVPFLLKDIGATQEGVASWWGNRAYRGTGKRAAADTELGARFRAAGLVTLGTSNAPELGSTPTCNPAAHGPARNPWDLDRSPAGSSGGACVAVAAGLVPIAHANDGGGSIRLPASWCGLVGLKPTRGRVPSPKSVSRLGVELVVSRSVRDVATALDTVAGATSADLFREAPLARPAAEAVGARVPRLRVALLTEGPFGPAEPDCVAAAEAAADALTDWGHDVAPVPMERLFGGSEVNGALWMAGITRRVDALADLVGRPLTPEDVEPYNWLAAENGRRMTAAAWTAAQEQQQAWAVGVHEWFDSIDLLVTPSTGMVPQLTEALDPPAASPWEVGLTYGRIAAFTLPFNATGHPAISIPLHWTGGGLPVGAQLVGRMGAEDVLLALAARFETERPWAERVPPVHAAA